MKRIILLGMILALIVSGCSKIVPIDNIPEEGESQKCRVTAMVCTTSSYTIKFVDEFNGGCYGKINMDLDDETNWEFRVEIEYAFEEVVTDAKEYLKNKGYCCEEYQDAGTLYCLKDNSTCMKVQDKICLVMNVSGVI